MSLRLGIDVGGTFTDIVLDGRELVARCKVRSTPEDPGRAVVEACHVIAGQVGRELPALFADVTHFGLGTTVVTNMLATRSGRRLGLLTTQGFEDLVPLARGNRLCEDGWLVSPPSLVARRCIAGVAERMDRRGSVVRPVDVEGAVRSARHLVDDLGVESLVVSFLWAFRNPDNELAVGDAIRRSLPGVPVVVASELAPVIREYERTQFALLNAYVGQALGWLASLESDLRVLGLDQRIVLTHSSGGAITAEGARAAPIGLAQSGPAAGAAAASALARWRGDASVVACDLGGTSLDVALVGDGEALRRTRGRIVGQWTALSMVDVDSVGSGGGSIAWIDPIGGIRVGPQSAGADPGPACYGHGGVAPTLTDALVVLGYVDPSTFLGGQMPLDAGAARRACATVGEPLGLDPVETAWGIREVALVNMIGAVRNRIASRGLDATDLALYAYGGCGALFGVDIAAGAGARRVVIPEHAPVFSAYGAATASLRRERARSVAARVPDDLDQLADPLDQLRHQVLDDLAGDGVERAEVALSYEADMRFERQGSELTISVVADDCGVPSFDRLEADFRDEYMRRFGEGAMSLGVAIEVMTLRAVGIVSNRADREANMVNHARVSAAPAGQRTLRLARDHDVEVDLYDRAQLVAGSTFVGPALVDAGDTTVFVAPAWTAHIDAHGALVLGMEQ